MGATNGYLYRVIVQQSAISGVLGYGFAMVIAAAVARASQAGTTAILLPWTLAFVEARLYTRRALFWSEVRQTLRACTAAALFAVSLSFAARSAGELSRLVIAGMWMTTVVAVPVVRYGAKRLLVAVGLWGTCAAKIGISDLWAVPSLVLKHPEPPRTQLQGRSR